MTSYDNLGQCRVTASFFGAFSQWTPAREELKRRCTDFSNAPFFSSHTALFMQIEQAGLPKSFKFERKCAIKFGKRRMQGKALTFSAI